MLTQTFDNTHSKGIKKNPEIIEHWPNCMIEIILLLFTAFGRIKLSVIKLY